MRLFVAITAQNIDFDLGQELKKLKINLSKKELEFKLVPVENLHVTLNFLGEISQDKIPSILQSLKTVSEAHQQFSLKLKGLWAFPDLTKGQVMWIAVQNSIKLQYLQAACEQSLRAAGLELENRDYRPHMTVARLRNPRNLKDVLSPYQGHQFGVLKVESVDVYESKLGGAFPIYQKMASFPLK